MTKRTWLPPTIIILSSAKVKSAGTQAIYESASIQFNNVYPGCSGLITCENYVINVSGSYDLAGQYYVPGTFSIPCTVLVCMS